MDSEYYTATGAVIAKGKEFVEPFIWNYLDEPTSLPHLAFSYWMPMPGLTAALGFAIFNGTNFFAGRFPFILLAGFIPVVSSKIAFGLTGRRRDGILAGLLAVFSGFYFIYLSIPESLIFFFLCGGLILLNLFKIESSSINFYQKFALFFLLGFLTGIMHMARSDGILWVAGVAGFLVFSLVLKNEKIKNITFHFLAFLVGYFIISGGWYYRNISVWGSLFPIGNSKMLWLKDYNQLFSYPSNLISATEWLNQPFLKHLSDYWNAGKRNVITIFGIEGIIFWLLS